MLRPTVISYLQLRHVESCWQTMHSAFLRFTSAEPFFAVQIPQPTSEDIGPLTISGCRACSTAPLFLSDSEVSREWKEIGQVEGKPYAQFRVNPTPAPNKDLAILLCQHAPFPTAPLQNPVQRPPLPTTNISGTLLFFILARTSRTGSLTSSQQANRSHLGDPARGSTNCNTPPPRTSRASRISCACRRFRYFRPRENVLAVKRRRKQDARASFYYPVDIAL
ncbi:uncharacterized protein BT62DRAFT_1009958 [Guyanagaster necrorhizus]|uniref:Uncharacterized protein n=1 Tax=Guyanagaster necrorhizus TaxID=856835 RepID=A0A9P7VMB2_9AGAR|nr:uncharacterized protein BT62DRAFT_1009958 [Guyanagaster necrorhizus MCA 3950]KAG7442950.1 hypothetical protein BT62DRAFT_1009958 [Guyanagaster necrorhizus MCA 3950]